MKIHHWTRTLCLLVLSTFAAHAASDVASLVEIGNRKQLFIDDYMIQSLTNAKQVLNTAVKEPSNPVLRPDRPWEGRFSPVSKVIYDPVKKLFKMWYSTSGDWRAEPGGQLVEFQWTDTGTVRELVDAPYRYVGIYGNYKYRLCYATSKDGVHWEKPNLGKVEFDGSRNNNLLPDGGRAPTFEDPNETDPAKRYKSIAMTRTKNPPGMQLHVYYSPDGFNWTPEPTNPVMDTTPEPGRWGPTHYMGWDPIRKVYAAHIENCLHRACPHGQEDRGAGREPRLPELEPSPRTSCCRTMTTTRTPSSTSFRWWPTRAPTSPRPGSFEPPGPSTTRPWPSAATA